MPGPYAIILIDHGSRRDEANRVVHDVADRLRARDPRSIVEPAHMELAEPSLAAAFARCVNLGARDIVIVPYFLASGNHVTHDIPALAREAAAPHPGVRWSVADPLGLDDRLVEIVRDRAEAARNQSPRVDPVKAADPARKTPA